MDSDASWIAACAHQTGKLLLWLNCVTSLPSQVLMKLASECEELGLAPDIISKPKDSQICNVTKADAAGRVWLHGVAGP